MTGYAFRVMTLPLRIGFILAGVMLLMPFQAARVNGWLNVAGLILGAALVIYEVRGRRAYVRA